MKWLTRRRRQAQPANGACVCDPPWPALEAEFNGYVLPALPAEHGSVLSVSGALGDARCSQCRAIYPHRWVTAPDAPIPFDWAHENDT
jgi:hypothetical protein